MEDEILDGITPAEFAAKIKAKYPQYKNIEDSILVDKMITKYPEYKGKINYDDPTKGGKAKTIKNGDSNSVLADTTSSLESTKTNKFRLPTDDEMNTFIDNGGVVTDSPMVKKVENIRKKIEAENATKKKQAAKELTDDIVLRTKYPELTTERDSLMKELKSRSVMNDNSDLEDRLSEIDKVLKSAPKSFRKIRKEKLDEIDSQMNQLERKGYALTGNSDFIDSSGTYQQLKKEREGVQYDIDKENETLNKLTEDTTITDQFIRFYTPKFLGNWLTPENETVKLDEKVEEKLLAELDSNKRLKSKVNLGGKNRNYLSLQDRENMIKSAKEQVLLDESKLIKQEYDEIIKDSQGLKPDSKEYFELQKRIEGLNERNNTLLFNYGYDKVNNQFNDVFKRTTRGKDYDEALGQGGLDVGSTFIESMTNTILDGTVGFAGWLGSLGDGFTDDDSYSIFDAMGDTAYELSNNNLLPSSKSDKGNIVDKDGNWNLSLYSVGKAGAEGLPFTLALINSARKGNVKEAYKKLGGLISPNRAKTISQSLQMADKAYRLTVSDNRKEALNNGLDGIQAIAYANFQSMATGLSQMIMPDTKFLKTPAGKAILGKFTNDLKTATTKEAISKASKAFIGNLARELGEEEIEGAMSEMIKFGMLQNHSNEFLTARYQKELIGKTLIVTGMVGGAGIKSNINATKDALYKDLNKNYDDLIVDIDNMMESSDDVTFKKILNNSKRLIGDIKDVTSKSPENVNGKQIDLLIEKKHLIQEMKSLDDSFHPEYKEKIENINEKIRKESSLKSEADKKDSDKSKTKTNKGKVETKTNEKVKYDVNEQLKSHNENEGSTFTLDGKNRSGEKGVSSVSIFPERSKIIDGSITEKDISDFKEVNKDILKGNEDVLAIGTWYDKSSGKTYLDVSAVTDTESATRLGEQYNQKAIFNLETFEEIDTKGDGKPVKNLKPELDRVSDIREVLKKSKGYKKIADEVRKVKINKSVKDSMSKLQSNPVGGLFSAVWDGAVETVAKSIEVTGDIKVAIEKGIEYLKNTDWYKNLSNEGKQSAENIFRKDAFNSVNKPDTVGKIDIKAKTKLGEIKDDLTSKLIDKYHFIRKVQNQLETIQGKPLDKESNFSQAEVALYGKASNDLDIFEKDIKELVKKISSKKLNRKQVSKYLYAKHAVERNAYVKANIDPNTDKGSGMTDKEAKEILDLFTDEQLTDLRDISIDIEVILNKTRKNLVKFGLMSQKAVDALEQRYENYVPLTNFADVDKESSNFIDTGGKISIKGKEFRKTKGRSSEAGDVLANVLSQHQEIIVRGRKNEVMQSLYNMVKENPDKEFYRIYSRNNPDMTRGIGANGQVTQVRQPMEMNNDYVGVKVDGESFFIKFANKRFAHILNASNLEKTRFIERTFGRVNRYLSSMLTSLNPEFVLSNFSRDIQTAVINMMSESDISNNSVKDTKIIGKIIKSTLPSLKTIYNSETGKKKDTELTKYYNEFKEDGAKTGWFYAKNTEDLKTDIDNIFKLQDSKKISATRAKAGLKSILNYVDNVNSSVENAVRLATYTEARKTGVTREDAATLAKELTVNFNRSGEWGTIANSFYLFFNASIQGTARFWRAMATLKKVYDSEGNITGRKLNAGQKVAMGIVAFSSLATIMNQMMSDDDDDGRSFYSKIPDYEKERNLIIMNPNGKDYFKIPLPYGYNIFHNLGSITTEVSTGERSVGDGAGFLFNSAVGAFSPVSFSKSDDLSVQGAKALVPTAFKPIVELAVNENHFGASIYNENMPFDKSPEPDSNLGRPNTNAIFKNMSKFMNEATGGSDYVSGGIDVNPNTLEYLMEYYSGGLGKFVNRTAATINTAKDKIEGKPVDFEMNKIPFVRKFVGEKNKYVDKSDYFEGSTEVRQLYEEYKNNTPENRRKDKYKSVARLKKMADAIDRDLKKIRKQRKRLMENKSIANLVKLNELETKELKLISKFNRVYAEK